MAQFVRVITCIIRDLMPDICRAFLDDLYIKGPTTDYDGEELEPGLRRFIVEHIQNIDKVLLNCELAGAIIAAVKSQWCCTWAIVVGYLCGGLGREPDRAKVIKIER